MDTQRAPIAPSYMPEKVIEHDELWGYTGVA